MTYPQGFRRHPSDRKEPAALGPVVFALVHVLGHAEVAHLHHQVLAHHAVPRGQIPDHCYESDSSPEKVTREVAEVILKIYWIFARIRNLLPKKGFRFKHLRKKSKINSDAESVEKKGSAF